ncbi:hypothetical protein BWI17_05260 [Betaproteobacteria bacterium GR16-43]|nr:hypothetical protein BWI17_05260 [Betaproteobacteria bacterium GR16-43]
MPPDAKRERAEAKGDPSKVTSADLAANAPDSYTVAKGDTLWSISGRFLKDPWKWPQVWQMNRDQIKNPHWIYPGDVIRLDRSGGNPTLALERGGSGAGYSGPSGGTAADAAGNMQVIQPRIRVEPLSTAVPSIPGTAIGPFLTQPLIIESDGFAQAPTILATEESRVVVGAGNTVYVDRIGERDGIAWQFFRKGEPLYDPETREILGYEAKYIGDGRVKRFGNPTTLEITKASQEINRGDKLAPARETAFPSYVPRAPDKPIKGVIMSVDGGVAELGQYAVITINRGSRDGIEVGHVLATYKRGDLVDDTGRPFELRTGYGSDWWASVRTWYRESIADKNAEAPAEGQSLQGQAIKLPDERNGLIFVFRVFEKMSYAIVMRASKPIYLGDVVQTP